MNEIDRSSETEDAAAVGRRDGRETPAEPDVEMALIDRLEEAAARETDPRDKAVLDDLIQLAWGELFRARAAARDVAAAAVGEAGAEAEVSTGEGSTVKMGDAEASGSAE